MLFRYLLALAGLALGMTFLQVMLAWGLSGEHEFSRAYLKLFQWDSVLYARIVNDGYVGPSPPPSEDHGNVAFFPGYPLSAWLIQRLTGWTTQVSLVAAAQTACWGFWIYVLLLLRRWRVSPGLAALGCLLIVSHPAAFFLIAGYSEALFLMSLLGFLYWSGERSPVGCCLAALHGFAMTATRIAGVPLVVYPLLHAWLCAPRDETMPFWRSLVRLLPPLAVAASAALGCGLFFFYCHFRFGQWDLYMRTQQVGWGVRPDYLAFLSWRTYYIGPVVWLDGFFEPTWFSRLTVLLTIGVFASLFLVEWRQRRSIPATDSRRRAGIYAVALMVFYICVSGVSSLGMTSMVRYSLGPAVLLVLCLIHLLAKGARSDGRLPAWLMTVLGVWILASWTCQIAFAYRFIHGVWVG